MTKRKWLFGLAVLALIGVAVFVRGFWTAEKAAAARAQGNGARVVPVEVAKAVRKKVPVRLDALGTVTPIASVALKARVDTTITGVHFQDGAHVNKGDKLFTLDCRQIEARRQAHPGASSTAPRPRLSRPSATSNAIPIWSAATPPRSSRSTMRKTAVNVSRATCRIQRRTTRKPESAVAAIAISARRSSGRISMANVKVGSFVRQADTTPMATIIQTAPVYVSFAVPQKNLPAIRQAIAAKTATVEATIAGQPKRAQGQVVDDREHRRCRRPAWP